MDAITMGVKKAQNGCIPCMHRYFGLAKSHGATDEEIEEACRQIEHVVIEEATPQTQPKNLGRRQLIKLAAAGGLATAVTSGWMWETTSYAQASAMPLCWGTDSSSMASYGMPQNFYVGRMGYGGEPAGDGYFFNVNAARIAGHAHTFGYWGVVGPNARPAGFSPLGWGQHQAACAWNAWHNGPYAAYIGGLTVFGDVERGFSGWIAGNYAANQAVLSGFLQELLTITPPHVWPGVYVSPIIWTSFFGTAYRPATDFVLWLTGCHTCGSSICAPSAPCNTLQTAHATMLHAVKHTTLGGRKPVMWQYWIGGCGSGDYDLLTQNSSSLVPVNAHKVYYPC
jgi:hypothetical protein